ncbi:unnamed protein product [Symbiodinium sp. CCMP2456]|nr:unnamed protein product [Symbiodinium sp. CCMP2456]
MDPEAEPRCAEKLQAVGLWGDSLAALEPEDAEGVAQQLVDELGLPFYDDVVSWVASCVANSQGMLVLSQRARGLHGTDLNWRLLQHKGDEHKDARQEAPQLALALPEKGRRKRKRKLDLAASERERQAAERQKREGLCVRLMAVLRRFNAPCLDEFSAGFEPERASAVVAEGLGAMIAALERLVSNEKEAMGIHAGAYYRLLKCWGTLRFMAILVARSVGVSSCRLQSQRLIPQELVEMWTEHSERATLPTILDGFGLDPRDRDALGRIHRYFVSELERCMERLPGAESSGPPLRTARFRRVGEDPILQESEGEDEAAEEEPEAPAEVPEATDRTSGYVLVFSKRGAARLHRAGKEGCWMARMRHFNECRIVQEMPEPDEYSYRCRLCWPGPEGTNDSSDDSSQESSGSASPGSEVAQGSGTSPQASWELGMKKREDRAISRVQGS